ncbi:GNAT family N-acetyltransferase [Oerskovia jenensis]|uniref:GNAT family N-acetyltransferase n=1 Tax=Oerskovia jenensis TaxID=162169 RepID=UPI0036D7CCDC
MPSHLARPSSSGTDASTGTDASSGTHASTGTVGGEVAALSVRAFTADDYPWLQAWYQDPVLDEELGPLDDEWLEYVLADETGEELVVLADGVPVAVVGIVWANGGNAAHAVTDVAVDPARRGTGLGRTALDQVVAHVEREAPDGWVAFVDRENLAAFAFFSALGWEHAAEPDPQDEDGMHTFALRP